MEKGLQVFADTQLANIPAYKTTHRSVSSTFLSWWSIITLCGFTSLCMIPILWQKSRAWKNTQNRLSELLIVVAFHPNVPPKVTFPLHVRAIQIQRLCAFNIFTDSINKSTEATALSANAQDSLSEWMFNDVLSSVSIPGAVHMDSCVIMWQCRLFNTYKVCFRFY